MAIAGLFLAGCGDKSSSGSSGTNTASSGNPLDAPGDYLKSAVKAQRDATMTLDTNSLTPEGPRRIGQREIHPQRSEAAVRDENCLRCLVGKGQYC